MSFELVNVGSGRLATDGECIRDAFVKINTNFTNLFTLVGITQNIITVNINNNLVQTQRIEIQNNLSVTMAIFQINVSNSVSNSLIIDITNSIELNIGVSFNINVDNSINIDIDNSATTVTMNNTSISTNTTNTTISNSETTNIITDNSTNNYTWIFQQDGNLRLPNGGTILDFSGNTVVNSITNIQSNFSVVQLQNSGTGALTYSNGVFYYTPPNITITQGDPSGNGSITQVDSTTFTYSAPDVSDVFRLGDIFTTDYTISVNTQITGPTVVGTGNLVGGGINITATNALNFGTGGSITIASGTGATDGDIAVNANAGTFSVTGNVDIASQILIDLASNIDIGSSSITIDGSATQNVFNIDNSSNVTIGGSTAITIDASSSNVLVIDNSNNFNVTTTNFNVNNSLTIDNSNNITISNSTTNINNNVLIDLSNNVSFTTATYNITNNSINTVSIDNSNNVAFITNSYDITNNSVNVLNIDNSNSVSFTSNTFDITNNSTSIMNVDNSNNISFNSTSLDITNNSVSVMNIDASNNFSFVSNSFDITNNSVSIMNVDASNNTTINNALTIDASQNISFDNSTTINFGSISMDFSSTTINNFGFNSVDTVNIGTPTSNQLLAYNGVNWENLSVAPEIFTGGSEIVLDGGSP